MVKHEIFIELFIEHNIFSKTSTKPSLSPEVGVAPQCVWCSLDLDRWPRLRSRSTATALMLQDVFSINLGFSFSFQLQFWRGEYSSQINWLYSGSQWAEYS